MAWSRARIVQFVSLVVVQALALMVVLWFFPFGDELDLGQAVLVVLVVSGAQAVFWYIFINFLSWLPVIIYPIATFLVTGAVVALFLNFVFTQVTLTIWDGITVLIVLTVINAILGAIFSLDEDTSFDRNVTAKIVKKRGNPTTTDVPGILYLEIDGLGRDRFERALREGYMPTLKKWWDEGKYEITGWETDYTAQTGAMQTGLLQGNNDDIPAYRWWDRKLGRIVMSGNPQDASMLEARLTNGRGLCADGGASRGNMFSGDATESLFTFSTLLNRDRAMGPGFYLFLFSPYIVARITSRFIIEVIKEWFEAWQQRRRHKRGIDKYVVSARNPAYAFLRAFMGPVLQDLTTYAVISDIARGVPAVYALYAGYDDLGHFAGMDSPEAFEMLRETDHYFKRIEHALQVAPRPYKIIILSDHGQSTGPTFKGAYGVSLEDLVKALVKREGAVYASLETNEAWDNLNAFLSESVNANSRTARLLRRTVSKKMDKDAIVRVGPGRDPKVANKEEQEAETKDVIVLASGSTGLVYFRRAQQRMTYEQIQELYPDLLIGLVNHPGIGLVLVDSAENGPMVLNKGGVYYLKDDSVDGKVNPLSPFGPNAALHVKRESGFVDCPDIMVNSKYDSETGELCGFENQVSHHGGLGGPQNHPFIFHPKELKAGDQPIITAVGAYRILRGWRNELQGSVSLEPGGAWDKESLVSRL